MYNKKLIFCLTIIALFFIIAVLISVYKTDKVEIYNKATNVKVVSQDEMEKENQNNYVVASWYDYSLVGDSQQCTEDIMPCYSQINDTCASREYPRKTKLKVTYNGASVICRVNDYGPAEETERAIDLSSHAFKTLAPLSVGLINVTIEEIK